MIVDIHSHLGWYPDHQTEEFASEALASKKVKLEQSGGGAHATCMNLHSYDSHPEQHWEASTNADRVVVFGLQAKATGFWVPNDLIADYAADHPDKVIGWASVDPTDPGHLDELERCVEDLKLTGLKLGPAYQGWDPTNRDYWAVFERCQHYNIPVIWHQGTTFPSKARLRVSPPLLLEDIAMEFPDLTMIVAHLAHPWETDLIVLLRKTPNLYADISAVHYRPWRYWQAMVTAMEYGATNKLLLGSDFPSATIDHVIAGLRKVNDIVEGTKLPTIPTEIQDRIIHDNWKQVLPELA